MYRECSGMYRESSGAFRLASNRHQQTVLEGNSRRSRTEAVERKPEAGKGPSRDSVEEAWHRVLRGGGHGGAQAGPRTHRHGVDAGHGPRRLLQLQRIAAPPRGPRPKRVRVRARGGPALEGFGVRHADAGLAARHRHGAGNIDRDAEASVRRQLEVEAALPPAVSSRRLLGDLGVGLGPWPARADPPTHPLRHTTLVCRPQGRAVGGYSCGWWRGGCRRLYIRLLTRGTLAGPLAGPGRVVGDQ